MSTDEGLPMTFEVTFTRATMRHSSTARSPKSCGLMRYQSRLVEICS